ncbi:MAG: CheR family methyltransferase [Methanomicrobiaceae archaeon]|nr:CheR family methyltransferase [Methanomicrobiaceae archaeon]
MAPVSDDESFEHLLEYIKQQRGLDFTGYKRSSLRRRVQKRMHEVKIEEFDEYQDYLEVHPEEFAALFNTILINVTAFFRDKPAWDYLAGAIVPRIVNSLEEDEPIRIWSAGCASGEEAYTIAIIMAESMGMEAFKRRVKIYATDVDEEALEIARHASYPEKRMEPVPNELREKYFVREGDRSAFLSDLRRSVIFGRHDLVQDAPISRLDLIVCRNTLMYFIAETQAKILERFHFALKDSGFLFLGKAEMLLTHARLFKPETLKHRVFTRVPAMRRRGPPVEIPAMREAAREPDVATLQEVAFNAAQTAQIVMDVEGTLVLANNRARSLFDLHEKDLGSPFRDLEISYKPVELRSPIEQVMARKTPAYVPDVQRILPDGSTQFLAVKIVPLTINSGDMVGVSVTFQDMTSYKELEAEFLESNARLEASYEELNSANEELETTNEELQSTVEELETTNEELQSTNEEMETMNEELQSTNEELETINDELRQRTGELNRSNEFLGAILASLHSGVVVVDRDYNVLIWSDEASDLWGLRADEVIGKSLLSLDIGLPVDQLKAPIGELLKGKADYDERLLDAVNRRGRTFRCQVIATPLVDEQGSRKGVVLLMEEVLGIDRRIVDTVREPLIILNRDLKVIFANRSFYATFRTPPEETVGQRIFDLGNRQWDIPELRRLLEEILLGESTFRNFEVVHEFPGIGTRKMLLNARRLIPAKSEEELILLAIEDMT